MRHVVSRIKFAQEYTDDMMIEDGITETIQREAPAYLKTVRLPTTPASPAESTTTWEGGNLVVPVNHFPNLMILSRYTQYDFKGFVEGVGNLRMHLQLVKSPTQENPSLEYSIEEVEVA